MDIKRTGIITLKEAKLSRTHYAVCMFLEIPKTTLLEKKCKIQCCIKCVRQCWQGFKRILQWKIDLKIHQILKNKIIPQHQDQ